MTIRLMADGQVTLTGPIANKIACYGLLELARQAVQNYDPAAQPVSQLLLARGGLPPVNGKG